MANLTVIEQSQIKATVESEVEFSVYFDDAWKWLDYSNKANAKRVLVSNFERGVDFELIISEELRPQGGFSNREDIYLTTDCFKQLAMLSGTTKGKEVRLYFLQCEKELKTLKSFQPKLPTNYKEALLALVAAEEEKEALALRSAEQEAQIKVLEPKAEVYDDFIQGTNFTLEKAAKHLNFKKLGRNNLMKALRISGVLMLDNTPYQQYVTQGYFTTIVSPIKVQGQIQNYTQTLVTPKGLKFLKEHLLSNGHSLANVA